MFRVTLMLASLTISSAAAAAPSFKRPRFTMFPETFTLTAVVTIANVRQTSGVLVAVIEDEVRGLQEKPSAPPFGPYNGVALYQMTIYADGDGGSMSFWFESAAGAAPLSPALEFEVNGNGGNALAPLMFSAASMDKSLSLGLLSAKFEL